ncbi:MAG: S9 family peptidase, partial [Gemmatimonadales bacterium]
AQNLSARREVTPVTEANYRLGARFAPPKMSRLVNTTSVNPRWIQGSERFWYEYTTAAGKMFQLVDPVAGTRRLLFDNDRLAAELTRITRDPYDGQNLPIRAIRFVSPTILHFEVESS